MASDNTATITFDADLSGLSDALDDASAGVADFGDQTETVFANLTASMNRAVALAPALSQNLANMQGPDLSGDKAEIQTLVDNLRNSIIQTNTDITASDATAAADRIKAEQQVVAEKERLGQISSDDALQQLKTLADQEQDINRQRAASVQAAAGDGDTSSGSTNAAKQQAQDQQRAMRQTEQLQDQAALKASQQWNDVANSISRAFTTSVQGIVLGTQTIQQAMTRLGQNILTEFVDGTIQKMVQQWLVGNQSIQTATAELQSFLGISDVTTAASSVATARGAASANIGAYASEGAAAAVASTAAIPLVGPELAPAAGTAIYADIMAFDVASAAGGWMVPSDQLAMVHENERVLPARYSAGLDAMVGSAAQGGSGGGHTFNNSFSINAPDSLTARQLPGLIQRHLERSARNGAYGSMRRG